VQVIVVESGSAFLAGIEKNDQHSVVKTEYKETLLRV
jgi:hypothetical protein